MANAIMKRMRPKMANYGIATDESGMLDWAWAEERLVRSRNYWVCSVTPATSADGLARPHAAPIWAVWIRGALYFGVDSGSRKARNLRANPEVVVHLESGDEVVIVEAHAQVLDDWALWPQIAKDYGAKYPGVPPDPDKPPDANTPYFVIRPRVVLAWLETDFPKTATRFEFNEV
jgi:hypothetical protein